jgi:serine/threonine protein phosphatase PrpC
MIVMPKIEAAARTDIGRVRRKNQDSFGCDEEFGLYVVCDGMGGAAGGEVASRIAVDTFLQIARQELKSLHDTNAECTRSALQRAATAANRAVLSQAAFNTSLRGMGTTLVAARIAGDIAIVVNVGDSRAYHLTLSGAEQLTRDHSYVNEQVARGIMTQAEANASSLQSVITRAIGAAPDVVPDLYETTLHPGDALLLCSDGLTRHLDANDLTQLASAAQGSSADALCSQLIDLANDRGGSDNITCLLVRASA